MPRSGQPKAIVRPQLIGNTDEADRVMENRRVASDGRLGGCVSTTAFRLVLLRCCQMV